MSRAGLVSRAGSVYRDYMHYIHYLTIGSCLACVHRVMDARGKFGEHERSVRVARGAAESNSSFLSALQTFQVHPLIDVRTAKSMNQLFYNIASGNAEIVVFRKLPQFYFASVETVNYKQYESVRS